MRQDLHLNEAILLVDATNTFNSINRQVVLHNIRHLCPAIATILINTYRSPTDLLVDGDILLSREGTTQGDPLAMPMNGLATISKLDGICKQVWYTDDSAAIGTVEQLHGWWTKLVEVGPAFSYHPNPAKTWLVTKQGHRTPATDIFFRIRSKHNPRPYLGAAIGTPEYVEEHLSTKVNEWVSNFNTLSEIARSQPQAAFSALIHGLLNKWTYLSRVLDISPQLLPLDDALRTNLLPAITGRPAPNDLKCELYALPA